MSYWNYPLTRKDAIGLIAMYYLAKIVVKFLEIIVEAL